MAEPGDIAVWDEAACLARADDLAGFFATLWPTDDWAGLGARLARRGGLMAVVATDGNGRILGCKLGHDTAEDVFRSWLGGVRPEARGSGLAMALMHAQHAAIAALGRHTRIETSTRQPNPAMAILNLKAGFLISGFEAPPGRPAKILFSKPVATAAGG